MDRTLIELYDGIPHKNILSTEVFLPVRTVYICPPEITGNRAVTDALRSYYKKKNIQSEICFEEASLLDPGAVIKTLEKVYRMYPDCMLDISGGTDAALFAAGKFCSEHNIPVFTFSRHSNCFFDVQYAEFAERRPCGVKLSVEDCFLVTGGASRFGRFGENHLKEYFPVIDRFFEIYLQHRRDWTSVIEYIQQVSQNRCEEAPSLNAFGPLTVSAERGRIIRVNEDALYAFAEIGFIHGLKIDENDGVRFAFRDELTRFFLRDIGSVLELYTYKLCCEAKVFHDVQTSVIAEWSGRVDSDTVHNEIDVMATCGYRPVFISCKTCEVRTEALNELSVLKNRFGGDVASAAIVTSKFGNRQMRNRAAELGITVIDINDLKTGACRGLIRSLAKAAEDRK